MHNLQFHAEDRAFCDRRANKQRSSRARQARDADRRRFITGRFIAV